LPDCEAFGGPDIINEIIQSVLNIESMTPQYSHLLPPSWKSQVVAWLEEDTPSFDYGGFVVGETQREAFLLGKGSKRAVLAGTPFVNEIFHQLDCMYV